MFQIKITYPKPLYLGDVATHTGDKEICFISGILSYLNNLLIWVWHYIIIQNLFCNVFSLRRLRHAVLECQN